MYIVKRATFPNFTSDHATELDYEEEDYSIYDLDLDDLDDIDFFPISGGTLQSSKKEGDDNKMIETAVFLDHIGYRRLSQVKQYDARHIIHNIIRFTQMKR